LQLLTGQLKKIPLDNGRVDPPAALLKWWVRFAWSSLLLLNWVAFISVSVVSTAHS